VTEELYTFRLSLPQLVKKLFKGLLRRPSGSFLQDNGSAYCPLWLFVEFKVMQAAEEFRLHAFDSVILFINPVWLVLKSNMASLLLSAAKRPFLP